MIYNGLIPTVQGAIHTIPKATPGIPGSGRSYTVNFFRVVNNSGAARTFTLYLNVNGTAKPITPVSTQLPIGAAWDDVPTFQLPPGATIEAIADATNVAWSVNVE